MSTRPAEPPISEVIHLDRLTPSIAAHLRWMIRSRRYQRSTIIKRYQQLIAAEQVLGAPLDQVSADRMQDWWGDLVGARSTVKTKISHVRTYFQWCLDHDVVQRDPTRGITAPRVHRGSPRPLDLRAVTRLLGHLYGRYHWAVALMSACGLRCEEAARVQPSVDLADGPDGPELVVHGKGGDERTVAVPADLAAALRDGAPTGYAFPSSRSASGHWTPKYMSRRVTAALRDGGITGQPTAHQLRHTYATYVYRGTGGDLLATSRALGHRSATGTQVYADAAPVPRAVTDRLYRAQPDNLNGDAEEDTKA
jgi:integrase